MRAPRVRVVLVAYNSAAHLPGALEGLRPAYEAGLCEVVVVDNASADGSAQVAAAQAWVDVVPAPGNLGFGRGCNLGAQGATTEHVLFLNPDARLRADALAAMVAFLDAHPAVGLAGPALRGEAGLERSAFRFPTPMRFLRDAAGAFASAGRDGLDGGTGPQRVDWVSGAVLLVRRSLFEALGGFDPRFFLYFEETDLCRRALAAGAETWFLGHLAADHAAGASARATRRPMWEGCIAEHWFESRFWYLRKHHGLLAAAATEVGELLLIVLRGGARWLLGRKDHGRVRRRLQAPILRGPRAR